MAIQTNSELQHIKQVVHDVAESKGCKTGQKFLIINQNNVESSLIGNSSTKAIQELGKYLLNLTTTVDNKDEVKEVLSELKQIVASEESRDPLNFLYSLFFQKESLVIKNLNEIDLSVDVKIVNSSCLMQIFGFGEKGSKGPNVTQAEVLAFNLYTSNAYAFINPFLRGQTNVFSEQCLLIGSSIKKLSTNSIENDTQVEELMRHECKYISSLINSGLAKLPKYVGMAYRGDMMTAKEFEMLSNGSYEDLAYMSFSTSERVGIEFSARRAKTDEEKHNVLLRVHSKNSRPVKEFAENKREEEVLYLPGQKFKVIDKIEKTLENPNTHELFQVLVVDIEEVN